MMLNQSVSEYIKLILINFHKNHIVMDFLLLRLCLLMIFYINMTIVDYLSGKNSLNVNRLTNSVVFFHRMFRYDMTFKFSK